MVDSDQRYNVYWVNEARRISGVIANVSRPGLDKAVADANRWVYGDDLDKILTSRGIRKAVEHMLDGLEAGGAGEYGPITLAYAADDTWEE